METGEPRVVVVMGVSGSGKTTIGSLLARRTDAVFADADDFHSPENKAKMHAGTPLTDEDRAPWLQDLNKLLRGWLADGTRGVLACSALKAAYRGALSAGTNSGEIAFLWLDGSPEMIAKRLQERKGTFMNPALLGSQLATLEVPKEAIRIVNDRTPEGVVDEILEGLRGGRG